LVRKDENTLHQGGRRLAWTVATVLSDAVARGGGNRSERAKFRDAVARAVENTSYTVEDAKKGFIVHLDIVDARWWTLFAREGLASSFSWRVYERGSSFTIYDRKIPDAWSVGVPRLAGPLEDQSGRIVGFTREKLWALSDRYTVGRRAARPP